MSHVFLRDDPELRFNFLENLCGVDYLGREPRFEVVYHLVSFTNRSRICLKVGVDEHNPSVPSLTGLWPGANYHERARRLICLVSFLPVIPVWNAS
jgi:NADH-quinone oxidoreductase subunit C